ncbi:MAG: preprotein translocase subunit SecG [Syntrophaceae bacterium]|nr:preprotein translocase subunit SecG [Syntrophaceae bacterium]
MQTLISIIHILMCLVLIAVVLLQAGKGANMGAAFGGSSQTVFGSSGPGTFLSKMTTAVAVIFMLTSLVLSHPTFQGASSVMKGGARPAAEKAQPAPQLPAAPAAQGTQGPAAPTPAPAAPAAK